jgi:transposase-like protein
MLEDKDKRERRSQRDYNMGFKLAVVGQVEKGELTYKQAQKQYGIQGRSTVLNWLRKHGTLDWRYPGRRVSMSEKKVSETPSQQIKRLERELSDERLKNDILSEVIDVVDRQYGAGLRKKYLEGRFVEDSGKKETA